MFSLRTLFEALGHGVHFSLIRWRDREIIGYFTYDRLTPDMFFLPYLKWLDMQVVLLSVSGENLNVYLQ